LERKKQQKTPTELSYLSKLLLLGQITENLHKPHCRNAITTENTVAIF